MKLHKLFSSVILLFLIITKSFAQQEQLYIVYPFMPLSVNPAYAGSRGVVDITGIYRRKPLFQNLGFSSNQQYLSFDMPIAQDKMAIGFQAFNASQAFGTVGGISGNLGFYGDYAYKIYLPHDGVLSLGAQIGLTQIPVVAQGSTSQFKTSLGLGAYYSNKDWYAGLSFLNLAGSTEFNYTKPVFLTAGYLFDLSDMVKLKTGILARRLSGGNVNTTDLDFNVTAWINQRFGIGVWYQNTGSEFSNKAILASLEVQLGDNIRVGYSYDFDSSDVTAGSQTGQIGVGGFHQLMFRYQLDSGNGKIATFKYF